MQYSVIDTSADITTAVPKPAVLKKIYVNTVLSAHTVVIKDGSSPVVTLKASLAAGTLINFEEGIDFTTNIIVDPDNSSTGSITLMYSS